MRRFLCVPLPAIPHPPCRRFPAFLAAHRNSSRLIVHEPSVSIASNTSASSASPPGMAPPNTSLSFATSADHASAFSAGKNGGAPIATAARFVCAKRSCQLMASHSPGG
eukprot:78388-Prymnesium_polylepis.1